METHHDMRLDDNEMDGSTAGICVLQLAQGVHTLQRCCRIVGQQICLGQQAQHLQCNQAESA